MESDNRIDHQEKKECLITVKHGNQPLRVSVSGDGTVADVMLELQQLTNVHPRGQKLIHKGRVLQPEQSLEEAKLVNGAKVMLIATSGLHQGSGPSTGSGLGQQGYAGASLRGSASLKRGLALAPSPVALTQEKARQEAWLKTGIVSLRDHSLQVVPGAVWTVRASLRVLDLGGNSLRSFPASVSSLTNLQKLRLSSNALTQHSIAWEALISLQDLRVLALDHNQISGLPPSVGQFRSLRRLALGHNAMSSLPPEIGQLSSLEWLDVAHNRLASIPPSLAECSSLVEINLSANFIGSVPASLGGLKSLKVLILTNNALKTFPPEVLAGCVELATLALNGNQITIDQLRQVDGWAEFDERRRAKYNKQIEFQAMGSSTGLEEGADAPAWHHW